MDTKEHLAFKAEIKATDDKGTFEGYGSVFGVVDSYNDVVVKGAFEESLRTKGMPSLLWQHRADNPLGLYLDAKEDSKGLYLKGKFTLGVQKAREAYELIKRRCHNRPINRFYRA